MPKLFLRAEGYRTVDGPLIFPAVVHTKVTTAVSHSVETKSVHINLEVVERGERLRVTLAGIERWEAEHGLGQDDGV
jgi:hypothetical protein